MSGYHIDYEVYPSNPSGGFSSTPTQTITVTLNQNDQGNGDVGHGSQGRTEGSALALGTYKVCEVQTAYNDNGSNVPLIAVPRPKASQGGSSGGTNQETQDGNCIDVVLTSGTAELKFLDKQASPTTLTVKKVLSPAGDSGKFNLQIDGTTAGTGADVGNGGTTGAVTVTAGVKHTVGETASGSTKLSDYTAVIGGDCAPDGSITLKAGGTATCTITNTYQAPTAPGKASIQVTKSMGSDSSLSGYVVTYQIFQSATGTGTQITGSPLYLTLSGTSGTGSVTGLNHGTYTVCEIPTATRTGAAAATLTVNGISLDGTSTGVTNNGVTSGDSRCYTFTVVTGGAANVTFSNSKQQR